MEGLHFVEEDMFNLPQDDLAEAFGTPPTRNNSIKPLRKVSGEQSYALPPNLEFVRVAINVPAASVLAGKKSKKMEREGTQAQKNKQAIFLSFSLQDLSQELNLIVAWIQDLMLSRRQNAKAQARKDARAFKELDTTCQVLGINGKQTAMEPAGADAQALHSMQRAVSEASRCALQCNCKLYSHKTFLLCPSTVFWHCCLLHYTLASSTPAFCLQRSQ